MLPSLVLVSGVASLRRVEGMGGVMGGEEVSRVSLRDLLESVPRQLDRGRKTRGCWLPAPLLRRSVAQPARELL